MTERISYIAHEIQEGLGVNLELPRPATEQIAHIRRVDIPTMARSVYDVTGAGDTATAAFAAVVASGSDRETAARLANLAAGIKVGKRGTACVSAKELIECIREELLTEKLQYGASPEGTLSSAQLSASRARVS